MTLDTNLLPDEKIVFDEGSTTSDAPSDHTIEERYVNGEVRIVVEQARYQLKQIPEIVRSADYNLQPSFQRRPRWSREKQSRLIESLIMNVPIPPIFLYEAEFGRYEVMDGRQRLTAINDYYAGNYALTGLREWSELNGRSYSRLPEQVRRGIDRRFLSAIVLLHETAKSSEQAERLKQLVFERINSGGEDLSAQEKRNALYQGPMNSLCLRLARLPSLCSMWNIPPPGEDEQNGTGNWVPASDLASNESYKTMEDAELVLRFFAHRQRAALWRGGRLDDYLTAYLKHANAFPPKVLGELERIFTHTSNLAFDILGERAFCLWRDRAGIRTWVSRPAFIAYDPIMSAFSNLLDHEETLRSNAPQIQKDITQFYEEHYDDFDGRKTNPADLRRRDALFLDFFAQYSS